MASPADRAQATALPWWLVLLEGIAMLLVGLLLVSAPGLGLLVLVRILGWYWLIRGMLSIVAIFIGHTALHWGWLLLSGLLGVLAGLIVLEHPLEALILVPTLLVFLIAVQGVVVGLIEVFQALRGAGWGVGILGILSILFGLVLLGSNMAMVALTALPIVLGVLALIGGIIAIVLAFRMQNA